MPKRIYSADEYLSGLEAQGIVVHDAMRATVRRLNGQGILEGYPASDDLANPLLPPGDARYEAGHAEKVRDAQEKIEAFRIAEEEAVRAQEREYARTQRHIQVPSDVILPAPPQFYPVPDAYARQLMAEGMIRVSMTRPELAALIQHLAASGHSAQRVAELAALLV